MRVYHFILVALLLITGCGSRDETVRVDGIKQGELVLDNVLIPVLEIGDRLKSHDFNPAETIIFLRDTDLVPSSDSTNSIVAIKFDHTATHERIRTAMDSVTGAGYWRVQFVDTIERKAK